MPAPALACSAWRDLSPSDQQTLRVFYTQVLEWDLEEVDLPEYIDYALDAGRPSDAAPPDPLICVSVACLDSSLRRCVEHGGEVLQEPAEFAEGRCGVIRDPIGVVSAVFSS